MLAHIDEQSDFEERMRHFQHLLKEKLSSQHGKYGLPIKLRELWVWKKEVLSGLLCVPREAPGWGSWASGQFRTAS